MQFLYFETSRSAFAILYLQILIPTYNYLNQIRMVNLA